MGKPPICKKISFGVWDKKEGVLGPEYNEDASVILQSEVTTFATCLVAPRPIHNPVAGLHIQINVSKTKKNSSGRVCMSFSAICCCIGFLVHKGKAYALTKAGTDIRRGVRTLMFVLAQMMG